MSNHASTQQLITSIEKKDRLFRTAQTVFMALLIITLIGVIFLQSRTLNAVQQQLLQQKDTVAEIKKDNGNQLDRLNRHLDCIVVYFQQANRAQLKIDDINKCTLSNGASVQQFFSQPAGSAGRPKSTATTPVSNQTSLPARTPAPAITRAPKTIFGMPLCIPFIQVCVL